MVRTDDSIIFQPRFGWLLLWTFRAILAVFVVQGADVPDEWWQSTEVAEHVVFGRGELTWEWRDGLRSYAYPLPFIVAFQLLKLTGLSSFPRIVWLVPRLMAATVCFLVDRATARVAQKYIFPKERAFTLSLLLSCSSWFVGFVGVRTQSNVVEALALLWALRVDSFAGFLGCCALGCALRITFAVPAVVLFVHRIYDRCVTTAASEEAAIAGATFAAKKKDDDDKDNDHHQEEQQQTNNTLARKIDNILELRPRSRGESVAASLIRHLLATALAGAFTLLAIAAIDRIFYGRWLCSPLNFLIFNAVSGLSRLFGTHPAHWYFTSALPPMFLTLIPLIGFGIKSLNDAEPPKAYIHLEGSFVAMCRTRQFCIRCLQIIGFSAVAMSFLGHKEMRFLYFTVPLAVLVATACWSTDATLWRKRRLCTMVVVLLNLFVLFFFGLAWQRAPLSAVAHLRSSGVCDGTKSFHSLTHCFALPGESFFHGCASEFVHNACPIVMATAEQREPSHERFSIVQPTASDTFLESPLEFVEYVYEGKVPGTRNFKRRVDMCCDGGKSRKLPDRLVLYDVHEEILKTFLDRNLYVRKKSFFHTWFPLEDYQGKSMLFYERHE